MVDARGRGVEIVVGCCLGTKHTIAHFNHIQIYLHDALLAPKELYQDGEICLYCLAQVGARVESEDVLCRLLGDCTTSADNTPIVLILLIRIGDSIPIEATVLVELGILVVDDSSDEVGGDVLQWRPLVLYVQLASRLMRLDMTEQHQRRERNRNELENQDEGDAAKQEGQQEVGEDTAKAGHLGRIFNYLRQLLSQYLFNKNTLVPSCKNIKKSGTYF